MRTTVTLYPELLARAARILPDTSRSAMLNEALRALIEREAALRLARLGGIDPNARAGPRRRAEHVNP